MTTETIDICQLMRMVTSWNFIHRLMDYTTVPAGLVGFINLNLVEMSYTYTLIIVFFIV